jgi:cytochrome c biogenesis protein CcmG, thiol:disulfide interchange protein DsbE
MSVLQDQVEAAGERDYYALFDLEPDASAEDIELAYRREFERYAPERAQELGPQYVGMAQKHRVLLDQAYAVLSDPERRSAYDKQRGYAVEQASERKGISQREVTFLVGGILAAMVLLAALWSALGNRSAGPAVTEVNYPAPHFVLRTLDGKQFDLAEHRGKVVLVNFWATWCEPCKEETPALQAAHQRLAGEGLVIVGVDLFSDEQVQNRNEAAIAQFANQYGVTYPIALDETGQVARDYRLYPIPVSYFIDRSGNVRYIRIGQLTTAAVEALFRRL